MIAYVLTRTANRPRMFARLRESLNTQDFHGGIIHVVHAETGSDYATGDVLITSDPLPASLGSAPFELHHQRLLDAVAELPPGWVTFIDDDDEYTSRDSLQRMLAHANEPDIMPIWRVQRAHHKTQAPILSPRDWASDLSSHYGRICWEAAAHHTSHIGKATIDANDGADGRYWLQLSQHLKLVWQDEVLTRPQAGKGKGRRRDY